ncbi:hypothetical protein [Streptomyces hygroscopicus]|uniref:hypothetical protein n=1 Tax=Streptomyces hygroscopicus TaxID=1912 RepID=UPI0033DAFEFA
MNYFRSQQAQHAFAEVRADALLRFFKARGLEVTAETRERIESCKDMDVLGTWLDRAATASRTADLFADG